MRDYALLTFAFILGIVMFVIGMRVSANDRLETRKVLGLKCKGDYGQSVTPIAKLEIVSSLETRNPDCPSSCNGRCAGKHQEASKVLEVVNETKVTTNSVLQLETKGGAE